MAAPPYIIILSDSDDDIPPAPPVLPIPIIDLDPPTPPLSPVPELPALAFPHPLDHLDSDMEIDSDPEEGLEHQEEEEEEIVEDSVGSVPHGGLQWEESVPHDIAYGSASSTRNGAESVMPTVGTPFIPPPEIPIDIPIPPPTEEPMPDAAVDPPHIPVPADSPPRVITPPDSPHRVTRLPSPTSVLDPVPTVGVVRMSQIRRWNWIPDMLRQWREIEGTPPSTYEIGESSHTIHITREPVERTVPLVIARLARHDILLQQEEESREEREETIRTLSGRVRGLLDSQVESEEAILDLSSYFNIQQDQLDELERRVVVSEQRAAAAEDRAVLAEQHAQELRQQMDTVTAIAAMCIFLTATAIHLGVVPRFF